MKTDIHPALLNLEPAIFWEQFDAIRRIPRRPYEEDQVRRYVLQYAAAQTWSSAVDAAGNVVCYVPGRGKGASSPTVILQAHMDMVCVKESGSTHDFGKDAIDLEHCQRSFDGHNEEVLKARGTTLGFDNGVGVAMLLALPLSPELSSHPPLELVFTVSEEVGLIGARNFDLSLLKGRRLINTDSFEAEEIGISGAASCEFSATWQLNRESPAPNWRALRLIIAGLPGGHSGSDIHELRPNALHLLLNFLNSPSIQPLDLRLAALQGGVRRNAIPPSATVDVWCSAQALPKLCALFSTTQAPFHEILSRFPSLSLGCEERADIEQPINVVLAQSILKGISCIPDGILAMSAEMPGLVESSNTLSLATTETGRLSVTCMPRSSKRGYIEQLQKQMHSETSKLGATCEYEENSHGLWPADPTMPLLQQALRAGERAYGKPPKVTATHASVECALFVTPLPGMQAISVGPEIRNAHSPEECVWLRTVAPFWRFMIELMRSLGETA